MAPINNNSALQNIANRFTLNDFHRIANGKYNAGEVTINSFNNLDIVNNHVKMTFLNNRSIDPSTTFAVKYALVAALERANVSQEKLREVRSNLGLPIKGDLESLQSLSNNLSAFKAAPLTREQVREAIQLCHSEISTTDSDLAKTLVFKNNKIDLTPFEAAVNNAKAALEEAKTNLDNHKRQYWANLTEDQRQQRDNLKAQIRLCEEQLQSAQVALNDADAKNNIADTINAATRHNRNIPLGNAIESLLKDASSVPFKIAKADHTLYRAIMLDTILANPGLTKKQVTVEGERRFKEIKQAQKNPTNINERLQAEIQRFKTCVEILDSRHPESLGAYLAALQNPTANQDEEFDILSLLGDALNDND